ncbi:putative methyltransferase-domain-containing protein [Lentinula edodes]|uniref:Protein N-terminal and lysine N-methyltransferase EFM7 n=1 Tax=Lentinula lateritia TaxID=40482 RepID=A0A9W8ZQ53_9AGAR|nr:putative methyltransferase-domain-containing protein [Lentinula edodes]
MAGTHNGEDLLVDPDEVDLGLDSVFIEAARPPSPEATLSIFQGLHKEFRIRLVGSHPLWGHHLWNSALSVASYLEQHPSLFHNQNILELGAGGALPSLVAAESGARKVVITDYPDPDLIQNIEYNVQENVDVARKGNVAVQGYVWGHSIHPLLASLQNESNSNEDLFDLIILSDLIFNHSQHDALFKTCRLALKPSPKSSTSPSNDDATKASSPSSLLEPSLLVFYTHHRPHLAHRDMEFFEKARDQGWNCVEVVTQKFDPMFPEDPGEEEIRATVHGWLLTRSSR